MKICGCRACLDREREAWAKAEIARFTAVTERFMAIVHAEFSAADEANAELYARREAAMRPLVDRVREYDMHSRDVTGMVEWEYQQYLRAQNIINADPGREEFWEWDEDNFPFDQEDGA